MFPSVGFQNTPSLSKGDPEEGFERLPSINRALELVKAKLTLGPLYLHITAIISHPCLPSKDLQGLS